MRPIVRDVMTTRVIAVREDASFKEMAAMLRSSRISAFPVIDEAGRVIGVVSEADLLVKEAVQADGVSLLAALRHWREDDKAAGVTAGDLMTGPAVTIGPDAPVAEAARLMYDRRVNGQIRDEIVRDVLPGVLGTVPEDCEVTVRDGIVTMAGLVDGEQDAVRMIDAVRHVQGVVAVRDRLGYPH